MKTFKVGSRKIKASHLWKTHPKASGSRRFAYIFRLCRLVSVKDGLATIRLSGNGRKHNVPAAALIDLSTVNSRHYELSL